MATQPKLRPDTGHELTLTRIFDAPRALVFRMWAGEHMRRWSCPSGFTITHAEGDAMQGGDFRVCMRETGGAEHWLAGTYLEVTPPERLVFTHAWEDGGGGRSPDTTVTVRLEEVEGGRTKLTLHQAFFGTSEMRDGHAAGWSESLDKLAAYLGERGNAA